MRASAAILRAMGAPPPYADSRPLELAEVELDPPGAHEVFIRIEAAGLCHSDLSAIDGNRPWPMPIALGHEACGTVEALGEGVTDLALGSRVVTLFRPSCGVCLPCAEGRPGLCEPGAAANAAGTLLGGHRRIRLGGEPLHHHLGCAVFASHAVVSRRSLVAVPADLPPETAALFGCAVLTGVGAVWNSAQVRPGASVAIVGLGGVGLAAVLGALAAGAAEVFAVDLAPHKLALARDLGATPVPAADAPAAVHELTRGGADHVLEFAGALPALEAAIAMTRRGGTTVTAGLPHPDARLPLPVAALVAEERTLKGSYLGGGVPQRDIARMLALHRAGRLPVDRLRSRISPLADINAGFDRLRAGEVVREIVVPG